MNSFLRLLSEPWLLHFPNVWASLTSSWEPTYLSWGCFLVAEGPETKGPVFQVPEALGGTQAGL